MIDSVDFELNGKTYSVRPTFEAILRIERRLGRSILKIIGGGEDAALNLSLTDMTGVVFEALVSSGERKMTFNDVGNAIMQDGGFGRFMAPVAEYLVAALTAGPEEPLPLASGDGKS